MKDRAEVRVFPPAVPLLTILAGVGLERLWTLALPVPAPARYWLGGFIVAAAVLILGAWAVAVMRRSGQSENPWKPTHEVVESGPFRFTRNPMYLQMVIVCIGFSILLANGWVLLLTPVCAAVLHFLAILPEEAYLERKFGEHYRAYQARVRRWI